MINLRTVFAHKCSFATTSTLLTAPAPTFAIALNLCLPWSFQKIVMIIKTSQVSLGQFHQSTIVNLQANLFDESEDSRVSFQTTWGVSIRFFYQSDTFLANFWHFNRLLLNSVTFPLQCSSSFVIKFSQIWPIFLMPIHILFLCHILFHFYGCFFRCPSVFCSFAMSSSNFLSYSTLFIYLDRLFLYGDSVTNFCGGLPHVPNYSELVILL